MNFSLRIEAGPKPGDDVRLVPNLAVGPVWLLGIDSDRDRYHPSELSPAALRRVPSGNACVTAYLGLREDPRRLGFQGENHWIFGDLAHDPVADGAAALLQVQDLPSARALVGGHARIVSGATPVCRRKFDRNGQLAMTHGAYPDAIRGVAAEEKVPLLELELATAAWLRARASARL